VTGRATPAWRRRGSGEPRPHGAGEAAILLGVVRFERIERIVQLIEEDPQVAVTHAQRG